MSEITEKLQLKMTSDVRLFDLLKLCYNSREDEVQQYEALIGPWSPDVAANEFWMNQGPKWLLYNEEGPVVAGGYIPVISGVYQTWMVGTLEGWQQYWFSITRAVRKLQKIMLTEGYARRLQTSAIEERKMACHWYTKGLGLKYEGTMYQFGTNGENMVNYAILREDING